MRSRLTQQESQRATHEYICGARQSACHVIQRPEAAEIGERNQKRDLLPRPPQHAHELRLLACCLASTLQFAQHFVEGAFPARCGAGESVVRDHW